MSLDSHIDELKKILEQRDDPAKLDGSRWAKTTLVKSLNGDPELRKLSPGDQLLIALTRLFVENQPSRSPRRGKRLDTKWGKFGLLAAMYFGPIIERKPGPGSLEVAWESIDHSIVLCLEYGLGKKLTAAEKREFAFTIGESQPAPVSTLSDWQRSGLSDLSDAFWKREKSVQGQVSSNSGATRETLKKNDLKKRISYLLISFSLLLAAFVGLQMIQVQSQIRTLNEAFDRLSASENSISTITEAEASQIDREVASLNELAEKMQNNYLVQLGFIDPIVVNELRWEARFWSRINGNRETLSALDNFRAGNAKDLTNQLSGKIVELNTLKTEFEELSRSLTDLSQAVLEDGFKMRLAVYKEVISLVLGKVDLAAGLPYLLGGEGSGLRSYLIVIQDTREERATGGLIIAAGEVLVQDATLVSIDVHDVYDFDNPSLPAPQPPWQLREYMLADSLQLRDANWNPDFEETSRLIQQLYAYTNLSVVDGIISLDREAIADLVDLFGPIRVNGTLFSKENFDAEWEKPLLPSGDSNSNTPWWRQDVTDLSLLIEKIVSMTLETKLERGSPLLEVLYSNLETGHILVSLDDPSWQNFLTRENWNGSIDRGKGDYLMVVESNLGFNKVSDSLVSHYAYQVDLTDVEHPIAKLVIRLTNTADGNPNECTPGPHLAEVSFANLNEGCAWIYLRVLTQAGSTLISSDMPEVPQDWMLGGQSLNGHIDQLEEKDGGPGVGFMVVVPPNSAQEMELVFQLLGNTAQFDQDGASYQLRLQKQAGSKSASYTVIITSPNGLIPDPGLAEFVSHRDPLTMEINLTNNELEIPISLISP